MSLTGSSTGSSLTDGSGGYTLTGYSGGNYTVAPSKATLAPGSAGITTVDVVAIQRHFLGIGVPLSGCRLTAADVNGVNGVNTVDVIAVQRFFLALSTGLANVGKYQFNPASRAYAPLTSSQTGQNYDALVFGDVASSYVHRPVNPPSEDPSDDMDAVEDAAEQGGSGDLPVVVGRDSR
jgi:hypothetical protein